MMLRATMWRDGRAAWRMCTGQVSKAFYQLMCGEGLVWCCLAVVSDFCLVVPCAPTCCYSGSRQVGARRRFTWTRR